MTNHDPRVDRTYVHIHNTHRHQNLYPDHTTDHPRPDLQTHSYSGADPTTDGDRLTFETCVFVVFAMTSLFLKGRYGRCALSARVIDAWETALLHGVAVLVSRRAYDPSAHEESSDFRSASTGLFLMASVLTVLLTGDWAARCSAVHRDARGNARTFGRFAPCCSNSNESNPDDSDADEGPERREVGTAGWPGNESTSDALTTYRLCVIARGSAACAVSAMQQKNKWGGHDDIAAVTVVIGSFVHTSVAIIYDSLASLRPSVYQRCEHLSDSVQFVCAVMVAFGCAML